jgi:hypothetical protein
MKRLLLVASMISSLAQAGGMTGGGFLNERSGDKSQLAEKLPIYYLDKYTDWRDIDPDIMILAEFHDREGRTTFVAQDRFTDELMIIVADD